MYFRPEARPCPSNKSLMGIIGWSQSTQSPIRTSAILPFIDFFTRFIRNVWVAKELHSVSELRTKEVDWDDRWITVLPFTH